MSQTFKIAAAILLSAGISWTGSATPKTSPDVSRTVNRMIAANGGRAALHKLGVVKLTVQNEETTSDGKRHVSRDTLYVNLDGLGQMRLEMGNGVVMATSGQSSWAEIRGQLDSRRQTPMMVGKTLHTRAFPLLLPFSLEMPGVHVKEMEKAKFNGKPAKKLLIDFAPGFFLNPILNTTWEVLVRPADGRFLAAQLFPPEKYRKVMGEGTRYRVLKWHKVGQVELPADILTIGVSGAGEETGHVRTSKITIDVIGRPSKPLFLSPEKIRAFDEGDI